MEAFTAALATAFELDPAGLATGTTDLVVDDFDNGTGPARVCSCFCWCVANFCACFGDGNGHPCSAPPVTGLVIDDFDRPTASACVSYLCTDGSVSPCFAPPDRLER